MAIINNTSQQSQYMDLNTLIFETGSYIVGSQIYLVDGKCDPAEHERKSKQRDLGMLEILVLKDSSTYIYALSANTEYE